MLINSIILAISSSIDSLGIGITYGIKNTKISAIGKIILFCISFLIALTAVWFGDIIKNVFSEFVTKLIGSTILMCMGIFIFFQSFKKDKKDIKIIKNENKKDSSLEPKIYSLFIDFLGITIKIIKNPSSSDFDGSKSIDAKEALFLGFALSLDSICIGISGSIIGISSALFPFLISIFQLIFLSFGNFLGRKLHKTSSLPDNIWSIISSILLFIIGFIRLF